MTRTSAQAFLYLQASVIGTLCNFFSRFAFSEWFSFGVSVVLANYVGMIIVFCLSYKRAFGVSKATVPMVLRFALVAHVGLVVVWAVSTGLFSLIQWLAAAALPNRGSPDAGGTFPRMERGPVPCRMDSRTDRGRMSRNRDSGRISGQLLRA